MNKKIIGSLFFLAAGLYLAAAKTPDPIMRAAVAGCLAAAVLAPTGYSHWAAIGGGMMVAGSLFLQSVLFYRCLDCIRADLILLAGVITLAILDHGRHRLALRVLSATITVFMLFTIAVHYRSAAGFGLERPVMHEAVAIYPDTPQAEQAEAVRQKVAEHHRVRREEPFVEVLDPDGGKMTLDAAAKPVFIFSPDCGACIRTLEALAKADPEGKRWAPVQSRGDPAKGGQMLKEKGYRGESYILSGRWRGIVPAMIHTGEGGIALTAFSPKEMIEIVGGGAD